MTNTSWDEVADWYDKYLEDGSDTYQSKVVLPNLLRLLEIKKGEKVLDLACGQGFFAREMANAGAEVVGVDISAELIKHAQRSNLEASTPQGRTLNRTKVRPFPSDKSDPTFFIAPAHQLSFLNDASMDKVVMVLALQNIENYQETLKEVSRVLKREGSLYIVLNHPAFRIPKESQWGFDPSTSLGTSDQGIQYRRVDRYLSELKMAIDMHPGSGSGSKTTSFHRPFQSYFKALQKAGFMVSRLEEWVSHKKSQKGPRAQAENRARAEIPLFLFLQVEKK